MTSPTNGSTQVISGVADANNTIEISGGSVAGVRHRRRERRLPGHRDSLTADATNSLTVVARDTAMNPSASRHHRLELRGT